VRIEMFQHPPVRPLLETSRLVEWGSVSCVGIAVALAVEHHKDGYSRLLPVWAQGKRCRLWRFGRCTRRSWLRLEDLCQPPSPQLCSRQLLRAGGPAWSCLVGRRSGMYLGFKVRPEEIFWRVLALE
jgi:hypothetical protein